MIEANQIKVDPHAAAAVKGGSTQNYIWPWIRIVGRSERLLRQAQPQIVVQLNIWDQEFRLSIYWQIGVMIARLFWSTAHEAEMRPVIAPKKDRKYQRNANQDWYQMRPRVENAVWHLKWWRGIATGCGKNSDSLLAAIQIGYIFLWATRDYTM